MSAQTYTTLFSFDGSQGAQPYAALVQGIDGNLYGTTSAGGDANMGTIFSITPSGSLTNVYNFCVQTGCADGSNPYGALVQARDGTFYGTTTGGGANGDNGTVFKIKGGILTTLHSFCSLPGCPDGQFPDAALILAEDGQLYGTTQSGGTKQQGTVFRIAPSGALITLHSFCLQSGCPDGAGPFGGLVQATDGAFYGTTRFAGGHQHGTIFQMTPSGTVTAVYSFCAQSHCTDGAYPYGSPIQGANGDLYGTTELGGGGYGSVFQFAPGHVLTTLHGFSGSDGAQPFAGLIQATDGNFYGTTYGGTVSTGTIFQITMAGALNTLYHFCSARGCPDGSNPYAGLVQDTNGTFYGTTYAGGANGMGAVFSLSTGLGTFVRPQPPAAKAGAVIDILGTNLTGTTSVSFNGVGAMFKVSSASLITATVPLAATNGVIQVVTPGGTLSSNVAFRVLP